MARSTLDMQPQPGCGVLLPGFDPVAARDEDVEAVRNAMFDYGVVYLRDTPLTPEQQIAFARRLGPIVVNRYFPKTERFPEIAKVEKSEEQVTNIGGGWHTDHSYDAAPAMGSMLLAIETPPSGGDTLFANMYAAYDALSDGFKQMLGGLEAHHASAHIFGENSRFATSERPDITGHKDVPEAEHPMVITHPGSGKKALYVNPGFTTGIVGWTREESKALLSFLYKHAVKPEFVHRYQWRPGSIAIWDNRCTWHNAMNDYHGHRRLMHRITLDGGPLS